MKPVAFAGMLTVLAPMLAADTLPVTQDAVFTINGTEITISRSAQVDPRQVSALSQPSTDCPAPCLAPMQAARNVATVGELDVIEFLSTDVEAGTGLLVDARLPAARALGHIPASVNVPSMTIGPANPYRADILQALGATAYQGVLSFDSAYTLMIYDGGPASHEAATMIQDLLAAGYPAEKLFYYRGGMQVWAGLGLSTIEAAQ